jgi:hypothetical protein
MQKPQQTVITMIPESSGLYQITSNHHCGEYTNVTNTKMTVDDLHCRIGHISPKAAEHMVKNGLVDGIDLDTKPTHCKGNPKLRRALN